MDKKIIQNTGLFLLAFIFSIGLMFAFTELPVLLDQLIQNYLKTPYTDPAYDTKRMEIFYDRFSIRLIGYICLGLIFGFIILGFTTKKTAWAWIGGIAMFLSVFATIC